MGEVHQFTDQHSRFKPGFAGDGELLDNLDEVLRAIEVLTEPFGLAMALQKISVSTAGHLDGSKGFSLPNLMKLALSLHASTDRERSQLMPINRRWPIAELLGFIKEFYESQTGNKKVLIQYTVIRGVNDSPEHAKDH